LNITILQGAFLPVPPIQGGAVEKIWYRMGQEFASQGHQVTHISRAHSNLSMSEFVNGVNYIRVKGYKTPSSLIKLKLLDLFYSIRAIKKIHEDTDVIVTNTFWSPILLRGSLGKKVYVSVERVPKGQMKFYKHAARLRANSTPVAESICKELPDNYHQQVVTIPNPLPFQDLPAIDFNKKSHTLLYVGRIHPEKGLDILIKAFKQLKTNWKLKIVGPWDTAGGGGGLSYLNFLKQLAGKDNVEFVGAVFDIEQLNKLYEEASVFVYPSVAEQGETFGLAPLEAMAWGCVPIVSSLACFQDFIAHENNGLIFNHRTDNAVNLLSNSIHRLQNDKTLLFKLAQRAMLVRRTHSITAIATKFLEEFETIINQSKVYNYTIL
jgi:glycosyltransferase involved in cell wall biosynthesis